MEDKKLIVIDCDGVLYPKEKLPTKEIVCAVRKAFEKKGISWEYVNDCLVEFNKSGKKGMFNFITTVARASYVGVDELSRQIAEEMDYSRIAPNPQLLEKIKKIQKKYEVCIYTNNTKYHLEKVYQRLFGCSFWETEIPAFHIETIKNKDVCCAKQSKESVWFLSKFFAVNPENMMFVDDTISVLDSVREQGASILFVNQNFNLSDALDYIEQISSNKQRICRHGRTPFDRMYKRDSFTQELF
ncbi:MAG: hypothetical protein IJO11_01425 [Alphaproteobacteria bacterium]|nr:hypothetical protein [Alphaproteobacteria bacterium]MBR3913964.1 hypothetical protein [Alphaproteobacteria bacterium]